MIVEISWKLSEIYNLEVDHSKFDNPHLVILSSQSFKCFPKHGNYLFDICSVLLRQISTKFKVK